MHALYLDEDDSKDRVRFFSHSLERDKLKPGDHIYVYRKLGLYQHHGIYTGKPGREDQVIHVSALKSESKTTARVRETTMDEFLDGGNVRLVAYGEHRVTTDWKRTGTTHSLRSRSASEVVATAKHFARNPDKWGKYKLFGNNCEDFATFCKTRHSHLITQTKHYNHS